MASASQAQNSKRRSRLRYGPRRDGYLKKKPRSGKQVMRFSEAFSRLRKPELAAMFIQPSPRDTRPDTVGPWCAPKTLPTPIVVPALPVRTAIRGLREVVQSPASALVDSPAQPATRSPHL